MKLYLGVFFCVLTFLAVKASPVPDTAGNKGFFYRGTEFTKIFTVQSGTPFLNAEGPETGWVNYYGSRYEAVLIQYDIEDDQLVSHDITGAIRMQLVKEKISSFGYNGREFVRLPEAEMFVERIYHGHHDVLIRWQKVLTRTGTEEGKYRLYKSIFIWNGRDLVAIQNNQDLFMYFGRSNRQVKDYFRDQGLSVKKDPEKAIVAIVGFADKNRLNEP
jgi:hypothetical protein